MALAIILLVIGIVPTVVKASKSRAVTLLYFRGSGMDNSIQLEWATATEIDTAGFYIERADSSGGPFIQSGSIGFIPSEASAGGLVGAEYQAVDSSGIINDNTYWYRLVEVELDGTENRSETISVVAGETEPTATSEPGETATTMPTGSATTPAGSGSTPTPTAPRNTGTLSASDATATAAAPLRTVTIREIATTVGIVDENRGSDRTSDIPGSTSSGSDQADPTTNGYPAPATPSSVLATENLDGPYPGNIAIESDEEITAYPAGVESVGTLRVPNISRNSAAYPDAQQIGNNINNQSEGNITVGEQEPLSTLMLWAGFLSSFMLFLAAVIGSAYYYRRQNSK